MCWSLEIFGTDGLREIDCKDSFAHYRKLADEKTDKF
jgi:hypothetical protein